MKEGVFMSATDPQISTARIITDSGEEFSLAKRYWQGCPTICAAPGGTLYGAWYTGDILEPGLGNYNLLVKSTDGGITWSQTPLLVIASDPEKQKVAIDVQLWLDPLKRMWLFWVERDCTLSKYHPNHLALFAIRCDAPDADELQWTEPVYIAPGFLRCQPTVLRNGKWLLPAYDWNCDFYCWSESADQGKSWQRRTGGKKAATDFDEGMFFETADGREIHLYARTTVGFIADSVSSDGGITWSPGHSSGIAAPNSRFFVRRLNSGALLLIYNDHPKTRTSLSAKLSFDEGKSWSKALVLDDSTGISYPDAVQLADNSIVAVYDRGRGDAREILCARFTEKDILEGNGKLLLSFDAPTFLRNIVSKAPMPEKESYLKARNQWQLWVKALLAVWDKH